MTVGVYVKAACPRLPSRDPKLAQIWGFVYRMERADTTVLLILDSC